MIKDIQNDVFSLLNSIDNINVYAFLPPSFVPDDENIVVFKEVDNVPSILCDGYEEATSIITYNIDIYCKNPETYIIRQLIDEKLTNYGFIRLSGGQEVRIDNFYYRPVSYRINL